jgi:hypothetical protein
MDSRIEELLDIRACEEVLMRYGRTQDWLDTSGHETCYWPDAEIDYGFFRGSGADWVPAVMQVESQALRRWHMTSSMMVQVDGHCARAESYTIAVGTGEGEDGELVDTMYGGRFLDELQKRNGEWRISSRRYVLDWSQKFPNGLEAATGGGFDLNILDIREAGHPLYRAF